MTGTEDPKARETQGDFVLIYTAQSQEFSPKRSLSLPSSITRKKSRCTRRTPRKHLAEGIAADYDSDGRLAGIEILDAVKRLGDPEMFRQVILEDIALGRQEQQPA